MPRTIEQIKHLAMNAHTFFCADTGEHLKIDSVEEDHFLVSGSGRFEEVTEIQYTEVVDTDKFYELKEMV